MQARTTVMLYEGNRLDAVKDYEPDELAQRFLARRRAGSIGHQAVAWSSLTAGGSPTATG